MLSLPPLIGHRGAKDHAPENTLASIREAARQGATWVEVDVKLTADGHPVLMHDADLGRTTDGSGPMAAAPLSAVRALDAGSWFSQDFAGERVPTLEETLDLVLGLGLSIDLEIKPCPGRERETAEAALAVAGRVWPSSRPAPLVTSFAADALEAALRARPDWPRGMLFGERPADWAERAERLHAAVLIGDQRRLTAGEVREMRSTGRPVLSYTVNDADRAAELFDWGVDAVFTDRPGPIAQELSERRPAMRARLRR
jgi:glycerophosphoryl diester phosphodiesterase